LDPTVEKERSLASQRLTIVTAAFLGSRKLHSCRILEILTRMGNKVNLWRPPRVPAAQAVE